MLGGIIDYEESCHRIIKICEKSVEVKNSLDRQNLVYPRFYFAASKLDDTNAFTLYNCKNVAPIRPAYVIKVQISVTLFCLSGSTKKETGNGAH